MKKSTPFQIMVGSIFSEKIFKEWNDMNCQKYLYLQKNKNNETRRKKTKYKC